MRLDAPVRARLLAMLREAPGRPLGELRDELGVGWGTLYYHIEVLERAGLARTLVSGRRKLAFAGSGDRDPQEVAGRNMLVGPTARGVARAIVSRPGMGLHEVGLASGHNTRVTYYHVRRLVASGLVTSSSRTRYAGLLPTRLLERLLREQDCRAPSEVTVSPPAGVEISCQSA